MLTYGGGDPVVASYRARGARRCVPIYNALDPATHHPAPPAERFRCDLALLANRLPDRERRIEHFFLEPAASLPKRRFLEPDREILVARDGRDVADHLAGLSPARARRIGERARARILADHTYDRRAELLEGVLADALARRRAGAA